jgi:hypothetical protein
MELNRRFTFFGASVTAQSPPHGYFDLARQAIEAHGGQATRLAFGSCHLDDAGFHSVHLIEGTGCEVCVLEWNTTGLSRFHPGKLAHVLNQLLTRGVHPVFLILPQDRNLGSDRPAEEQLREFADNPAISLIDIRHTFPGVHLLRDTVHTTPEGAAHYAQAIVAALAELPHVTSDAIAAEARRRQGSAGLPEVTFRTLEQELVVEENHALVIDFVRTEVLSELLLWLTLGPDSPILQVTAGSFSRRVPVWDAWCHYDRKKIVSILEDSSHRKTGLRGQLSIHVLPDLPDYSTCRRPEFSYSGVKRLRVQSMLMSNFEVLGFGIEKTPVAPPLVNKNQTPT